MSNTDRSYHQGRVILIALKKAAIAPRIKKLKRKIIEEEPMIMLQRILRRNLKGKQ